MVKVIRQWYATLMNGVIVMLLNLMKKMNLPLSMALQNLSLHCNAANTLTSTNTWFDHSIFFFEEKKKWGGCFFMMLAVFTLVIDSLVWQKSGEELKANNKQMF